MPLNSDEMGFRMFAFSIRAVAIQHRFRGLAGEGMIVTDIAPEPSGLWSCHFPATAPAPWYRPRGSVPPLITCTPTASTNGRNKPRALPDPVSQGGTIQIDAIAGINFRLAMQRQVVAKFPHEHMRQQTGTGEAAVDRQAGSRRLGDALAATAGHFRTHMPGDAERPGHVFQYLGHVFSQTPQRAAAFRAGTGGSMFHHVTRQVFRQRLTFGLAPPRLDLRIDPRKAPGQAAGSDGAVSAISSSRSPMISSSCSIAPLIFSDDDPNRWRNSFARRAFSCSI